MNFFSFLKNVKITTSVYSLILMLVITGLFVTYFSFHSLSNIKKSYDDFQNISASLASKNDDLHRQLSETQKWLNDVAATQQDDGFDFASENSTEFNNQLAAIIEISKANNHTKIYQIANNIQIEFQDFYKTKVALTEMYLSKGADVANKNLLTTDKKSQLLEKSISSMTTEINALATLSKKEFETSISTFKTVLIICLGTLGTGFFLSFLFMFNLIKTSRTNGNYLQDTAEQLQEAALVLSRSSIKQATSLEETAAAIEEITGNIKANGEKSIDMAKISNETRQIALSGNELVKESSIAMHSISQATTNIADGVFTIEQIAFQTNILSLNAAVEAATAGEHGRGFAVVAAEVRSLAAKSAEAAKQIKDLVSIANQKAERGNQISSEITNAFTKMIDKINQTNDLVEEVAIANKEQMIGMEQISHVANELDHLTQENVKSTQETTILSEEILSISKATLQKL